MLNLTDSSFNLVKYHLAQDPIEYKHLKILRTNNIQDVIDTLIESVSYTEEGLRPSIYLIYYTGTKTLDVEFKQSSYNTTYLVVDDISKWKHLKTKELSSKITFFSLKPTQYVYILNPLLKAMDKHTFAYFWSEYCIGKFNSNPYKWYNEGKYLLYLHQERNSLFTKEDIDCIYNNVSDVVRPYLRNIFTNKSKEYILKMTPNEKFVVFIGVGNRKALIEHYLTKLKPELLEAYMIFKQSFYDGVIRLDEAVFLFDYLINKEKEKLKTEEIRKLFGLN